MQDRILRRKDLLAIVGFSSATLHRKIAAGEFSPPLKLGPNMSGWKLSTALDYINSLTIADTVKPVAPGSKRGRKPKIHGGTPNEI